MSKKLTKNVQDNWIKNNNGQVQLQFMVNGCAYRWSRIGRYDDAIALALANKVCNIDSATKVQPTTTTTDWLRTDNLLDQYHVVM